MGFSERVIVGGAAHEGNEVSMRNVFQNDVSQLPFVWTRGIAARETPYYLDRKGSTPSLFC